MLCLALYTVVSFCCKIHSGDYSEAYGGREVKETQTNRTL